MKLMIFLISIHLLPGGILQDTNTGEKEIMTVLKEQVAAWNKGSIEGFMAYYWKSREFTFQSGSNRILGWEALFSRYQNNYGTDKMGDLEFQDLLIKVLADDLVMVLGRWHLTFEDSSENGGLFTIILRKMPEGWRIIHDHTS